MKAILVAGIMTAAALFSLGLAQAQERLKDGLLGAGAGALVGGPVGAIAGGAIGYTAGPHIARTINPRHRTYRARRHYRHGRAY